VGAEDDGTEAGAPAAGAEEASGSDGLAGTCCCGCPCVCAVIEQSRRSIASAMTTSSRIVVGVKD
jgi:hypothetical protein